MDEMTAIKQKILEQRSRLKDKLVTQFKGEKPFSKESFTSEQKLWAIDNLGIQDMDELRQEFGDEAVGNTIFEINKLRNRREKWQTGQI